MSTFTNWNGPQGSNVRAQDLIELANAYSNLVTQLNQHVNAHIDDAGAAIHGLNLTNNIADASANKVHTAAVVAAAVSSINQNIENIQHALSDIAAGSSGGAGNNIVYNSMVEQSIDSTPSSNPVSESGAKAYVDAQIAAIDPAQFNIGQQTLPDWANTITNGLADAAGLINGIANALSYNIQTGVIGNFAAAILSANNYIQGLIHADTAIDFTKDCEVRARNYVIDDTSQAGDEPKAVYIVGELSELWDERAPSDDKQKSATIFIKMTDTKYQFNIIANVSATKNVGAGMLEDMYSGALSATTSFGSSPLEDLRLHLVAGSNNNTPHVYVALSSATWANDSTLTAVTDAITFEHVAGINFIPATYENTTSGDYPTPARAPYDNNDQALKIIASTKLINGFSASAITFEALAPESINTNHYNNQNGQAIITYNNGTIIIGNTLDKIAFRNPDGTTSAPVTTKSMIGQIVLWPNVDEYGSPVGVPDGYHALGDTPQLNISKASLFSEDPDADAKWNDLMTALGKPVSTATIDLPAMTGGMMRVY